MTPEAIDMTADDQTEALDLLSLSRDALKQGCGPYSGSALCSMITDFLDRQHVKQLIPLTRYEYSPPPSDEDIFG